MRSRRAKRIRANFRTSSMAAFIAFHTGCMKSVRISQESVGRNWSSARCASLCRVMSADLRRSFHWRLNYSITSVRLCSFPFGWCAKWGCFGFQNREVLRLSFWIVIVYVLWEISIEVEKLSRDFFHVYIYSLDSTIGWILITKCYFFKKVESLSITTL